MASPQMRARSLAHNPAGERRPAGARHPALRLLEAERAEEVFPLLLEEVVGMGFPRAMVAAVDFDSGAVAPTVSLHCPAALRQRFQTSLYAADNPLIAVLQSMKPAVLPGSAGHSRSLYCHPLVFRSRSACWEAEGNRHAECLAFINGHGTPALRADGQVCRVCELRGYAAVLVAELPRHSSEKLLAALRELIEVANQYLVRLTKFEHYYSRMTGMETTIAQMHTVMQSMADPVILTDTHHNVILQNKAAARFFTVPETVSEGRVRAVELNNLLFSAALSSMAVSGSETSRDLTLVDAIEGEEMLFEAVCAPTYNHGVRTGMVTVMRDVTDLRRADQEVRENYERLREAEEIVRQDRDRLNVIIENVGDPIIVCDSSAKPVLLDPLAQELFGASGQRKSAQVKNEARFDAYITAFTYSFSDRESGPLRLQHPATRSEIEYDARSGKIYDDRGQVAFTVTVLRDLTALRKVEQLKVERRMLEIEKFAATGRLAGTIAHEVNNPMEAIKNAIFLLNDAVKPDAVPIYNILKSETERVARIVRQMLGLYRSGEQVGNIDINVIIEDTLLLFSRQMESAGVKVTTRLGKLPPAMGSADQLRQVFSNLVVNARDSMPEGGELKIRTKFVESTDGLRTAVRILIGDTGAGIPEHLRVSVFQPFVTTKGEKGTGLGLWIVKGIVENHGGSIRVRSRLAHGTVFKIDLPAVREA